MGNALKLKSFGRLDQSKEVIMATLLGLFWVVLFLAYLNFFQASFLFFFLFLICLVFIIFRVPEAGIHISILSVMVFERWFSLEPLNFFNSAIKIYPLDIVLILTALAVFLNSRPKEPVFPKKTLMPILIFFGAIVFWSALSLFQGGDSSLIGSAVKNTIFYSLVLFIVVRQCRSPEAWKRVFATILMGGLLLIGFVFYGILAGEGLWSSYTPLSTSGTRLLAATHAFFLVFPLYLLITLYAFKKKFLGKADFAVLLIWMVGLIFSLFRNLWLGIILGVIIILLFLERKQVREFAVLFLKIIFLAFAFSVVLIWLFYLITADTSMLNNFSSAVTERAANLNPFAIQDESALFRLAAWEESWKQFAAHSLIGIGFGREIGFELLGNEYKILVRDLHNDYVAFALQMGVIGFAALIYFIAAMIKKGISTVKRAESEFKPYLIAALAFFCTFLVLSAMGTYWETNFFLVFFWLALGMIVAAQNLENKSPKE